MSEKGKTGNGKKGSKTQARATVNKPQRNLRTLRVSVETAESTETWQLTAGTRGRGKAKSKVSEVSESESNKTDDGTWTPASAPQPTSSSQVNTVREVGYADKDDGFSHQKTAPKIDNT